MDSTFEIFTVLNEDTHRSYTATALRGTSLETVWASQKSWFSDGAEVTIRGEDGRTQTFVK